MKTEDQINILTGVAADVKSMLAVHNEKIEQHERKQDDIFSLIEQRRQEMADDIKEIHSRISTVQRELSTEIQSTEKRIVDGLEDLKNELKEDQKYHNDKQRTLDERVSALEKWRYLLVGAGIAGGYFLTKFGTMFDIVVK